MQPSVNTLPLVTSSTLDYASSSPVVLPPVKSNFESPTPEPEHRNLSPARPEPSCSERVWTFGKHCLELDGVRGIAILLVTLYRFMKELDPSAHWTLAVAKRYCDFGDRGVDLFFVLSGFLITGILLQTKSAKGYFRNFISRRALRIFPLYFTTLAVCLYVLPTLLSTTAFQQPFSQQGYLWTYTSNARMAWTNTWCFGPLDHFWSLAVEEHFYLVWPLVVFLLSPRALTKLAMGMIVTVAAVRTVAALRPEFGLAVDTLTLFRCDALAMGALLASLVHQGLSTESVNRVAKWILPALIVAGALIVVSGKRWMGIPHTVFGCLWVVGLAYVVTRAKSHRLSAFLRVKPLLWLGQYSYGMYVFQLPLVTLLPLPFVAATLGWDGLHPAALGALYVGALFMLTCGLAFVSFHCLEKPFLRCKRWFA